MIIVDETDPVGELEAPFEPRQVELRHDEEVRDYFDMKKEIGRGRFGTVYLCNCRKTGVKFAAKFINTNRKLERRNVEREIEIMKTLHEKKPFPKLIQLYDAFDMKTEMCLILEIVDGGELFERVINDDFVLTEKACVVIVKQICMAVEFIHSKNILHLDMKPENILCLSWAGNRVKICDFGLARKYDPRKKLQVLFGTPEFVAPEVVNFEPISFGTDMWSVGVICYVLLSGLSPFMGHNFVETMTNVTKNLYDFDDEAFDDVSDQAINFIKSLLILDKSERLTSTQCLRHDWIRKPLQPSTRARRRRSTTISSDDDSSDEDQATSASVSRKQEATNVDEDDDDDVFAVPTKTETDEGKKRKISEDVLEKNNTVSDKKRKDDDSLSEKKEIMDDAEEKMSTSSLNTSMMTEPDSSSDKFEENRACVTLQNDSRVSDASDAAKDTAIPVVMASPVKSNEEKGSVKVITQPQISDDPMSGSNMKTTSEMQKVSEQNTFYPIKDPMLEISSFKPSTSQRIAEAAEPLPKLNVETLLKISSTTSEKKEDPPPEKRIREMPDVTSKIDKQEFTSKETESSKSAPKANNLPLTFVEQKPVATTVSVSETPPTETYKQQTIVDQKASFMFPEACKTIASVMETKQKSLEHKTPSVTKDRHILHPIEIKNQPKATTQETKMPTSCASEMDMREKFAEQKTPTVAKNTPKSQPFEIKSQPKTTTQETKIPTASASEMEKREKFAEQKTPTVAKDTPKSHPLEMKSQPKTTTHETKMPTSCAAEMDRREIFTEQKVPTVAKDTLKSKPLEIKSQPKPTIPEPKPTVMEKKEDKPNVRRREVPITIEKHEISKPVVRKREIPMTTKTEPPVRRRESHVEEWKKGEQKPESKGRIIPITLEQDVQQPIRKREVSLAVSNTADSRQRQRQREVTGSGITATKPENSITERRRETPIVEKNTVVASEATAGTATCGTERKRETPVVSLKKKEEEPKSNAKRDLSSDELELEITKKQLKEFVERWNSHPDSPYVIGTPILLQEIGTSTKPDGWNSRASLASVAVAPPSIHEEEELSDVEMVDIGAKEEFTHYVFDQPHPVAINKTEVNAKQLEQKLTNLKAAEKLKHSPNVNANNTTLGRSNSSATRVRVRNSEDPPKRPEIDALQRDEPRVRRRPSAAGDHEHGSNRSRTNSSSTSKMPPGRDVPLTAATGPIDIAKKVEDIYISDRRDTSPTRRQRTSGRHRPSRDMPTKPNKDGLVSIPIAYEPHKDIKKSRSNTPTRRGRKTSREERNPSKANSRAHSRESNHSSTGKVHRRPSRDAPMTSAQTERLGFLNISGCEASEGAENDFLWPDMRVVHQNDDIDFDDNDDDSEAALLEPVTFKLELPVVKGDITTEHSTTKKQLPSASSSAECIQESSSSISLHRPEMNTTIQRPVSSAETSKTSVTLQSIAPVTTPSPTTPKPTTVSSTGKVTTVTTPPVSNVPLDTKTTNTSLQNSRNMPSPTPPSKTNSMNKIENDSQSKQNSNETTFVSENKLVAWIMDLGTHQKKIPLSGSTTDLVSHFEGHEVSSPNRMDREKSPRPRDRSPMPSDRNRERSVAAPKPPFGCPLTREKSHGSVNLSDTSDNIIQTPWGTLKRSSSRNSINKSPSKNSVNSSPTSTSLLRTTSSEIPLIRLEEEMDTSHNSGNNRHSFASLENNSSKTSSRSPSPRSFRPYNTKSLTTKNLSESVTTSVNKSSSDIKPSRSSSSLNKEVGRSPSPPISRPPIPSPTMRPNRLSLETKVENSSRNGPLSYPDKETKMSSFDKKVTKQTSLEVLNHIDKQELSSSRATLNGLDRSPTEVKFNTIPRPTSSNKDSSPSLSRSSSKPPSGESKRNSLEISSGDERRKSRTLPGVPMPPRKQFSFLLFSAHDRISEFEKKDDKPTTRTQRPITRSKTSTHFTDENTKDRGGSSLQGSSSVLDKQPIDEKKISVRPSVVSSKFPFTNIPTTPPLMSNSRFNLPLTITSRSSFSAVNPLSPLESTAGSPTPLSPSSPSSPFKFPTAKVKTSTHIGFMRDRFIEKQGKINPVTPFSSASSVSRITSNRDNGFDQMNAKLHRRIMSVNSLT